MKTSQKTITSMSVNVVALVLGIIWALPVTLSGFLLHVLPLWLIGAYEYVGRRELAFCWALKKSAPQFVQKLWKGFGANSVGNIIVFREHPAKWNSEKTFIHELEHTKQVMRLGVFHPMFYVLCMIVIKIGCKHSHPYYDNVLEMDCRRAAGQIVDITKFLKM